MKAWKVIAVLSVVFGAVAAIGNLAQGNTSAAYGWGSAAIWALVALMGD